MERVRINQEHASRVMQQKQNSNANSIVDNRPQSSLSFLSSPTSQMVSEEENEPLQGKFDAPLQKKNETGMPDNLKSGIESLSGFSMDDVRVHYNSSKPATVQALAYTQGTDIHVAPGQEKHLPHEAWHVVQQMSDRIKPNTNVNGMPVNNNPVLEHEADVMGAKAISHSSSKDMNSTSKLSSNKTMVVDGVSQFVGCWEDSENGSSRWSNLRSGVWWYMNANGEMWYEIEDITKIPEHLRNGYEINSKKKKSREQWVALHEEWAKNEVANGAPLFGMELELDRGKGRFMVEKNVEESVFKAKQIFTLADGLVDVTFDTDTNYDIQKNNQPSELTIELVFNAKKIPLTDDIWAILDNVTHEIYQLTYTEIEKIRKNKFQKIYLSKDSTDKNNDKVVPKAYGAFGIHITMACPLSLIHELDFDFNIKRLDKEIYQYDDEVINFYSLINSISHIIESKEENIVNTDPKQNMSVMNRTSFGKIFSLMNEENQKIVIDNFDSIVEDFSYDNGNVTKNKLKRHLIAIILSKTNPPLQADPSYKANNNGKFGISALGDITEKINGKDCPIFEFRANSIDNIDELANNIQRKLNKMREVLKQQHA